jgi:hypothetical protein
VLRLDGFRVLIEFRKDLYRFSSDGWPALFHIYSNEFGGETDGR